MDNYTAVAIAEGFQDAESEEQYLEAWQTLVDSGLVWKLQGFFGRNALNLIANGLISPPVGYEYNEASGKLAKV